MTLPASEAAVTRRVFLFGCPRSGTTILQTLMAGHSRIHSFPETSFFIHAIGWRRRHLARLGLARARFAVERVLHNIGRDDLSEMLPRRPFSLPGGADQYVRILDRVTLEEGKDIWLEKSPMHFRYIPFIERHVPDAHFVHILRNGEDVVASVYDRAMKFPDNFGSEREVDVAIRLWNEAVETSKRYVGRSGHTFALYEQLCEAPDETLTRICRDLGLEFEPAMKDVEDAAGRVVSPRWGWLANVGNGIQPPSSKFQRLFDDEKRSAISRRLRLDVLDRVKATLSPP